MLMNSGADFSSTSKSLPWLNEPRPNFIAASQHLVAMITGHDLLSAELKVNLVLLFNPFYSWTTKPRDF